MPIKNFKVIAAAVLAVSSFITERAIAQNGYEESVETLVNDSVVNNLNGLIERNEELNENGATYPGLCDQMTPDRAAKSNSFEMLYNDSGGVGNNIATGLTIKFNHFGSQRSARTNYAGFYDISATPVAYETNDVTGERFFKLTAKVDFKATTPELGLLSFDKDDFVVQSTQTFKCPKL